MKCISLFVCFFIGLQSMIVPSYEVLISNIESKVDTIHEDRASFLSLKCRDIAMDVTSKKTDLRIEMDKQEKCVDELERRYKHKKNYYELKKMEYGLELQAIQKNNSILYPYKIQKNLSLYFDEYRNVELEYLKHKKQFDKNQNTLLLYDEYLERLSNCQSRLLKRFSHLAQINESGQHNEDSMISGTEHLPDFGGYESWQQNGMSCLVDGNYEIDSYSSFWQNPVENGTISAGCWSYPDGGLHLGLDIASAMYSDVLAVANGIVLYAHAPVDSNNAMARLTCASSRDSASHMSMSSRRSTSPAASIASASNTVRLPSRISPPTGLPVLRLDPMTSRRSSASWNAKPSGNPIASASLRASAGARPAASIPNSKGAIVV